MATVVELLARLRADSSQFTSEMEKAAKATEKIQASANQTSASVNNLAGVFKKVATGAIALYAIKLGMDSVRAAQAASVSQDRLARLLLTTGGATEAQIKILNAHAAALEASTVVTKTNITTVQSQLATFDLHGSTIAQLTPAILDYVVAEKGAGASADEFRQMTNGLAQALNGQFASLTAVGFVLDAETKKKIKSGTESERAIAITEVLNSTYKDFAKGADENVQMQIKLGKQTKKLKEDFGNALLPVIQNVQKFMSTILIPVLGKLLEAFKSFTRVLGQVGKFVSDNIIVFGMIAAAIATYITLTTAARIATSLFGKTMGLIKKVQQAYAFWTYTTTGATVGFAGAMNLLKTAFMSNPIGIIVTALVAVGVGFKMAWDRSETFRKVVISVAQGVLKAVGIIIKVVGFMAEGFLNLVLGPLKLFLKVLGFINPDAKKAYEGLKNMTNNVGKFFDDTAKKVEDYGKTLDKYAKITVKAKDKAVTDAVDLSGLGTAPGGKIIDPKVENAAKNASAKLAEQKADLVKAVANYNDYLKFDFAKSFMNGADAARNAVMGSLDKLEAVFEAKGKMLSGSALEKLRAAFQKVNKDVRVMMEQYAGYAQDIEDVSTKLESANDVLQKAIEERASSMAKFGELLRTPFGEPSEIQKALKNSEATVDSVIGMYDTLVETVNQRFTGMDQGAKSLIVNYLTDQTAALVKLVKRRSAAVDALKDAEKELQDILQTQAAFQQKLTGGVKDFAKALVDLSNTDTKAVISVTKTANGLVVSQVKKATTGIDSIVKQLTDRLTQVVGFGKDIEKLLAAGLSREYIQQLLEAGPQAASETAALLTTASVDQISQINSLYTQINTQADKFGKSMSETFYGNSVAMAQAFVAGAQAEVTSINNQMTVIVDGITNALAPLRTVGTSIGTDLAQGLFDKLTAEKARLVGLAESIAAAIAAAMASAMAASSIDIGAGGVGAGDGSSEPIVVPESPVVTEKKPIPKPVVKVPTTIKAPTITGTPFSYTKDYPVGPNNPLLSVKKPVAAPIIPISRYLPAANQAPKTGPLGNYAMSTGQVNKPVTVNISTQKVVPTVTATTISKAISSTASIDRRSR